MKNKGRIVAISVSQEKGTSKRNVVSAVLIKNFGIKGDAHAGSERQISILPYESINKMIDKGVEVKPGDFAENITTEKVDFSLVKTGDRIRIGKTVLLEVTHKGKNCHNPCRIFYTIGDCVMPKEGVFAKVLKGGKIKVNDEIELILND